FAARGELLLLYRKDRGGLDLEAFDPAGATALEAGRGVVGSRRQILDRQTLVVIDRAVGVALGQIRSEVLRPRWGEAQRGHGFTRQIPEADGLFGRGGDACPEQQGQSTGDRPHPRPLNSDICRTELSSSVERFALVHLQCTLALRKADGDERQRPLVSQISLARFPLERNRLSDKKSRQIRKLERVLIAIVYQLLRKLALSVSLSGSSAKAHARLSNSVLWPRACRRRQRLPA